jgi:hypothetical protein
MLSQPEALKALAAASGLDAQQAEPPGAKRSGRRG